MGQAKDPAGQEPDELERALRQARKAGQADPDAADIAADDAGGSAMAETLDEEDEAKPPGR